MSHSPDNKDNGLILWNNVLQFHEVVRMEWGPSKQISNRVNTWNYDKKVGVLLLTNFVEREAQHYFQTAAKQGIQIQSNHVENNLK